MVDKNNMDLSNFDFGFSVVDEQELEESAMLKRSKLKRWSKLFDEPK